MEVKIGEYPQEEHSGDREAVIKIDDWDVWSVDETLKLIIHPLLVKLKRDTNSYPCVDEEGVEGATGMGAWLSVLDKMIYAFDPKGKPDLDEYDFEFPESVSFNEIKLAVKEEPEYIRYKEDVIEYEEKCKEGLRLFAKYFTSLWT